MGIRGRAVFALLVGWAGISVCRAGSVAPDLARAVASAQPTDRIRVVVMMREFPDERRLLEEVRALAKGSRRALVAQRMRSTAAASQAPVRSLLAAEGIEASKARVLWGINGLALEVPARSIERVAALPAVKWVLHDPVIPLERMLDAPTNGDESRAKPGASVAGELAAMGAEEVWNTLGHTGAGTIVAVIDTGVDRTHLDLADHIWTNLGETSGNATDDDGNGFVDDTWGWDFCNDDADPIGTDPHGTNVAGQIAGDGTRGIVTGMAPDAELMVLQVCAVSTWWAASDYAIANGAHVISQSLSLKWPDEPNFEAFRRQAATELAAGLIHANSTGNTGTETGTHPVPYNVSAPGNCPPPWHHPDQTLMGGVSSIISAANIDYWTHDIAATSPYGPAAWEETRIVTDPDYPFLMPTEFQDFPHAHGATMGLLKPDIAAYGDHTTSTCMSSPSGYCLFGGTSAATPHIAGALALMLSADPEATPEALAEALLSTAQPYTLQKSNRYGVGLVQAHAAVAALLAPCSRPAAEFTVSNAIPRVGDTVLFDSTVSGGAGAPYTYRWDFDGDGVIDSTVADPVHVYPEPYEGPVTLWVEDAAGCGTTERGPTVDVSGPSLRFAGISALSEIDGNSDTGLDPGETWEVRLDLRNDGNEPAIGVVADVLVHGATSGPVSIVLGSSSYPDIPAGQTATSTAAYQFRVGNGFPCGGDVVLALDGIASTDPDNTYPSHPGPVIPVVNFPSPTLFFDSLEDAGWALNGEWEIAVPEGLGTPPADPASAFEGERVLGTDLAGLGANPGNYENNLDELALSPIIDIPPGVTTVIIGWKEWLSVAPGDTVSALVWSSATTQWTTFHEATDTAEGSWTSRSIDVSTIVKGADRIRVQFKIVTNGSGTRSGWNIDAVEVVGLPVTGCHPAGAYPRHEVISGLAQVSGNGDGAVDPGETWSFTEQLVNIGAETATGVSASIAVHPSTAGAVSILLGTSTYPSIGAGQIASSNSAYRFRVADGFPCGATIRLSVTGIATTPPTTRYPDDPAAIEIAVAQACDPQGSYPRYHSTSGLTEIEGNGDASLDPGEIWDLTLYLRNDGAATAEGVRAGIGVGPAAEGTVYILQGNSTFPDIGPGQVAASQVPLRIRLADDYACGNDVPLSVTGIRTRAATFPDEIGVIALPTSAAFDVLAFSDDFETAASWAVNGEWQIGPPLGLGGPDPDPSFAFDGQNVLGYDLSGAGAFPGNYENSIDDLVLSPLIDLPPGNSEVRIDYARWLNVLEGDTATIHVWQNVTFAWTPVFHASNLSETAWSLESIDVTTLMEGASRMAVQFRMTSDAQDTASGWNVDDFEVHAGGCTVFDRELAGRVSGLTLARGGPGQLELSWNVDCGGGSAYSVYRGDLSAGYASLAPVPGRCAVPGTSVVIPEGPSEADFFLVVPHKNDLAGSYGLGNDGQERPAVSGACYPQGAIYACVP